MSDDEEEKVEKKEVKPSINWINFVKATTNNNPRETVKNGEQTKQNTHRKRALTVNAARPINVVHPKRIMIAVNQESHFSKQPHSFVQRPNKKLIALKNSYANKKVNNAKPKAIGNAAKEKAKHKAVKGKRGNIVKASACWVWKPKHKVLDHVSRHNSASITLKKFDYVDAQDYKEIDGRYVAFGGNPKGGKITGKVVAQSNDFLGTKASNGARKEKEPKRDYILIPLWTVDSPFSTTSNSSHDNEFQPSNDGAKKVDEDLRKENECNDQGEEDSTNNTNRVNTVTSNINVASFSGVNAVGTNISINLSPDPNMPSLKDIGIFEDSYDDEDVFGAEADFDNLNSAFQVSPILTTRIHKDHPLEQVIRDLHSEPQTRRMTKNLEEHGLVGTVIPRTDNKDLQNCLFACFLC
uniref:Uncharacterized protein n=1 Tax=Tanacetum cinerariifolium TaxID=118510 RepID=A0A6L2K8H0_TANCI|nr:hypothetical protein [Tanacetum cinerariifolium]